MLILALLLQAAPTTLPVDSDEPAPVVITGERNPATVILGSRIARRLGEDPGANGAQIASNTGMAGLVPTSGMDPFAGGTRRITKRSCRADVPGLSTFATCALARANEAAAKGDGAAASAEVERLLADEGLTPTDRFFAWRVAWQLAHAAQDGEGRNRALSGLYDTALMRPADAVPALKSLAAAAMATGDRATARARFTQLLALAPDEAVARGNLAVLTRQDGEVDEARAMMARAVADMDAAGRGVPDGWRALAAGRPVR